MGRIIDTDDYPLVLLFTQTTDEDGDPDYEIEEIQRDGGVFAWGLFVNLAALTMRVADQVEMAVQVIPKEVRDMVHRVMEDRTCIPTVGETVGPRDNTFNPFGTPVRKSPKD